jgi:hypothetical protein
LHFIKLREIVTMSWGFMLLRPGRVSSPVTHVRDDKLRERVLARLVRTATLPRARVIFMRAQRLR